MAETTMEAVPIPTEEPKREKKKRKFLLPFGVHDSVHRDHHCRHLHVVRAGRPILEAALRCRERQAGDDHADRRGVPA